MNPGEEYMRNLIRILDVLESVTRENILLQELAGRTLGSTWREGIEPLRQDSEIQRQIAAETEWMLDAKRRLRESIQALEQAGATKTRPESSSGPIQ
jgi:hypothetical protein